MPLFANTIDNNEIYAKRAECDAGGNNIQTTYATKSYVNTGLAGKQDAISDLSTIRSGAAAGATAVQPGDLATVATTGNYDDLSNQPTIRNVPASTVSDADKVLTVDSNGDAVWMSPSYGLFEAVYGQTSYSDVLDAINAHKIVYCRISATGASRMAFLAYIGASNAEFQYYRSLNSHSASNQTDEVYVYTVSSTGWTTTTRLTGIKYAAGTHMTSSFANNTLTFQSVWPDVDQTYDATSANAQSGVAIAGALATKEDSFDVGTGLEMDTTGATPTLQVEAPVDIVAGPGIAIDNPDGNTMRISQSYPSDETVLYDDTSTYTYGRSSVTLSESIKNFELIKIYTSKGSVAYYWPHNPQNVHTAWLEYNGYTWHWTVEWSFTSNTVYEGSTGIMWKPAQTDTISVDPAAPYNRWLQPVKIVGIHRIANN